MEEFQKTIVFTKTPLEGYFRYSSLFQIYPADLIGMPKCSIQNDYPIILEYRIKENEIIKPSSIYEGLEELFVRTASTNTKVDEILNLLMLFTNHVFFRYSASTETGNWGIPILNDSPGEEEANSWSSKWNMKMFHWPELPDQLKIKSFTDIGLEYPEVNYVRHRDYYQQYPNYDFEKGRPISFPDTIHDGLNAYYSLGEEKQIIDMAISHSVTAVELRQSKKTLSIISAFTAIETMVNLENKDFKPDRCENCGQLQYKVAAHYRDYLLKYLGNNDHNKKKFNQLYKLRSKIVHTGSKLETENLWNDLTQEDRHRELITILDVILISKFSIIHWLTYTNPLQTQKMSTWPVSS